MKTKTPRQVLGVPEDADADTIRKAHRKLVMKYHPDRNPGVDEAALRLREINWAYAELTGRITEPDNEETAALEYVLRALLNVMNFLSEKGTSPREVNVLGMMTQWLSDQKKEIHQGKVANEVMARNLREAKSRFQGQAKETLVQMIGWQLGKIKEENKQLDQTLDRFDRALTLLKDTTFDFTKPRHGSIFTFHTL